MEDGFALQSWFKNGMLMWCNAVVTLCIRQVLLEQQNTLRLIQSDPSHAASRNHSVEPVAGSKHATRKSSGLSPWDPADAVTELGAGQALRPAKKASKKIKNTEVPLRRQQQLEIPAALTALLQTVKQASVFLLL
jgi:hypothetical protein